MTILKSLNGALDQHVRAGLAVLVTVAVIAYLFLRGTLPQELMALATFAWGYYFGQPAQAAKSTPIGEPMAARPVLLAQGSGDGPLSARG